MNVFEGHTEFVTSVAFSADSKRIVSASVDCTARVWEAATGVCLMCGVVRIQIIERKGGRGALRGSQLSVGIFAFGIGREIAHTKSRRKWRLRLSSTEACKALPCES